MWWKRQAIGLWRWRIQDLPMRRQQMVGHLCILEWQVKGRTPWWPGETSGTKLSSYPSTVIKSAPSSKGPIFGRPHADQGTLPAMPASRLPWRPWLSVVPTSIQWTRLARCNAQDCLKIWQSHSRAFRALGTLGSASWIFVGKSSG